MVFVSVYPLLKEFKRIPNKFKGQLIDTLRLSVKAGHGGNGFPKYGGVGGQGGCVYCVAKEDLTLAKVLKRYPTKQIRAGHGEDSCKARLLGRRGMDIRVEVPVGVTILDDDGKKLGELNDDSSHCIVARGGGGGCTGTSFIGRKGEQHSIKLDLKLIADVGLVGFPNAGKSTLLKAISNARPKIADYPFTTIRPQIGIIDYPDLRQISMADLPGLIEGAHTNIGMGHKFLKHIERTRLLVMVVDMFGFKLSPSHPHRSSIENVFALNKELELYDESLFEKPCILLLNKMDLSTNKADVTELIAKVNNLKDCSDAECPTDLASKNYIKFERIIPISAKDNDNVTSVKTAIRDVLDDYAERQLMIDDRLSRLLNEQSQSKIV
ncbi:GTP-binding protein 10 homolog [Bradysia coprophila]|uniref:GTP-binding protein 10 homolog n=1 Tax=Bradysia coprophila TaxID=38358 RepID=UPI00187D8F8F|nr:GTP-binding protein 10 homolog [Bradysia coprophila]